MALACAIEVPGTGIILNYWSIQSFTYNAEKNEFSLSLAGYVSKAEKDAGKRPLPFGIRRFQWSGANNPVTPAVMQMGCTFTAVYAKVKQSVMSQTFGQNVQSVETNPFVNATDVL